MALCGSNPQENPADRGNRGKMVKIYKGKFVQDNFARSYTELTRNCNYVAIRIQRRIQRRIQHKNSALVCVKNCRPERSGRLSSGDDEMNDFWVLAVAFLLGGILGASLTALAYWKDEGEDDE